MTAQTVFAAGYGATVGPTRPRAQPAAGPAYTLQSLTLFVPLRHLLLQHQPIQQAQLRQLRKSP